MVKGPMTVTGFIAYAQGWGGLYIRANKLAWKLVDAHPGPGHQQPLRHSRLPRARALGGRVRARGRRARRLRLRPGALLVADPPPDQLDGRRRLPAQRRPARSAATIRRATCCSSTARSTRKYVEDGRHLVEIEQEARNQDGELSVLGTGIVELPARAEPHNKTSFQGVKRSTESDCCAQPCIAGLAAGLAFGRCRRAALSAQAGQVVVALPGGQGTDVARALFADQLSKSLGQPFFVENKPGAGGNIGTESRGALPPRRLHAHDGHQCHARHQSVPLPVRAATMRRRTSSR